MKKKLRLFIKNIYRRRAWRRLVSISSCIVVFVTTYALLLPAITMGKMADCGLEEHQHSDECYREYLICGLEESKGHQHSDSCYTIDRHLICTAEEHTHDQDCYDAEGNLTCALEEHSHSEECYREDRILSCQKEETEGHCHDASCYEKVLVCEKEVHTHSAACFNKNETNNQNEINDGIKKETAETIGFARMLTDATSLYTLAGDEEDAAWIRTDEKEAAEIGAGDTVRLYYAYTIPAGTLQEENAVIRYALPANVRLRDEQIEEVNAMNKGRGAQAVEGTRTPDLDPTGEEFVSAWIQFENIYDDVNDKDPVLKEQDIVLTFDKYSIEKNRKTCDENGNLLSRGEEISGFFCVDVTADQIQFEQNEDKTEARITLVEEDSELGVDRIRRTLQLVEKKENLDKAETAADESEALNESAALDETEAAEEKTENPENEGKEAKEALEKTLTYTGSDYTVSVTCPMEAEVPADTVLAVSEIMQESETDDADTAPVYDVYVARTGKVLGLEEGVNYHVRLFDIKIVDTNGDKILIQAPVDVKIELAEQAGSTSSAAETQIVHFEDPVSVEETASDQAEMSVEQDSPGMLSAEQKEITVEAVELSKAEVVRDVTIEPSPLSQDGMILFFEASGFSVYAVVEAPEMPEIEESTVKNLQELSGNTDEAFYLSVTRNGTVTYFTNDLNSNSAFKTTTSTKSAASWFFEPLEGQQNQYRIYTNIDGQKKYITNPSGNLAGLSETESDGTITIFEVSSLEEGRFLLKKKNQGRWLQYSNGGTGFRFYTTNSDKDNTRITLTYASSTELPTDPLNLDGKTYGLMNYSDGLMGEALMASALSSSALKAQQAIVRVDPQDREEKLFISQNSDISMWTFHVQTDGTYKISASEEGQTKFLKIDSTGLSLVGEEEASLIEVVSGTGANQGKVRLSCGGIAVSWEDKNGFKTGSDASNKEWMSLVEKSVLGDDDFVVRSAVKVSVSDTEHVSNGAQILIYKRVWNDNEKKYEYYALDQDGGLVPCFESGDRIEWVGSKLNKLLWTFTESYYEGTNTPNYYYQLYNPYSGKYISPGIKDGQILSDTKTSVNLNGRRYRDYFTTIIAWDDPYYSYAGLKSQDGRIVSCPMAQAEDFYFAVMQDSVDQDSLSEVKTVDHTQNGITMKMVNFKNDVIQGTGCTSSKQQNEVLGKTVYYPNQVQDLVSTKLDENGYPTCTETGISLGNLYEKAEEVNHLFIKDTYEGTGYYVYDSTQNFASLQKDKNFKVYQQLGTMDNASRPSLKHGQFMPYNTITQGLYSTSNDENLYDALQNPLSDDDPRKYEKLYKVNNPDYYFGMELEASFVQPPDGLDAWGHDIIYEFTGDDDFWLYVDGELVINLGGIHSALGGKVNYSTGKAVINGRETTIYDIFKKNYAERNNLPETDEAVTAYLDGIFTVNARGEHVFKDYSSHTMKIFYMERGAGASNLYMRFNLASVRPDQVLLNKTISGTDKTDYKLAEYPFQVFYRTEAGSEQEFQLGPGTAARPSVTYQNTNTPVKYSASFRPAGGQEQYSDVFFLNAGDTAAITLPEGAVDYRIVECGIDSRVYDQVSVNDAEVEGTATSDENRKDYTTTYDTIENRRRVSFDNHVDSEAVRTLTITKKLFREDGITPITDDDTGFNFRLNLGSENDTELPRADMQEYCVKNPEGRYCVWNADTQSFSSTGKSVFSDLTSEEKLGAVFHTSMNGAISKIPADYKVEVRDLLAGTKFAVTEESYEIPAGYAFLSYEREEGSYIIEDEDTVNTGVIRPSQSPAIVVNNKRGFGLTVEKKWSDQDFTQWHDDIYFAVYVKENLLRGTVRRLKHPATSIYYYFDTLEENAEFSDYVIREVIPEGNFHVDEESGVVSGYSKIHIKEQGSTIKVYAEQTGTNRVKYDYTVSYETGIPTGGARNARTDTTANTRVGIILKKTDWKGDPLPGASFELKDEEGRLIGGKEYVSSQDGLIAVAYLNVDKEYTLEETVSPKGYQAMPSPLKFKIGHNEKVVIIGGDSDYYDLATPTNGKLGTITVKNRPMVLRVVKTDKSTGQALGGAKFALYKEKTVGNVTVKDDTPMEGFEELISDEASGFVPGVDEQLPPGVYYLEEKESPDADKYTKLAEDIRFSISADGTVNLLSESGHVKLESALVSGESQYGGGTLVYTMTVANTLSVVPLKIIKVDQLGQPLEGAVFDISFNLSGNNPEDQSGAASLIHSQGGDAVIYKNDAVPEGTITLIETKTPESYNELEGPVVITIHDQGSGIMVNASINGTPLSPSMITKDKETGQWTVKIMNSMGIELPSCGGTGIRLYTLAGLLLLLVAGGCLVMRHYRFVYCRK